MGGAPGPLGVRGPGGAFPYREEPLISATFHQSGVAGGGAAGGPARPWVLGSSGHTAVSGSQSRGPQLGLRLPGSSTVLSGPDAPVCVLGCGPRSPGTHTPARPPHPSASSRPPAAGTRPAPPPPPRSLSAAQSPRRGPVSHPPKKRMTRRRPREGFPCIWGQVGSGPGLLGGFAAVRSLSPPRAPGLKHRLPEAGAEARPGRGGEPGRCPVPGQGGAARSAERAGVPGAEFTGPARDSRAGAGGGQRGVGRGWGGHRLACRPWEGSVSGAGLPDPIPGPGPTSTIASSRQALASTLSQGAPPPLGSNSQSTEWGGGKVGDLRLSQPPKGFVLSVSRVSVAQAKLGRLVSSGLKGFPFLCTCGQGGWAGGGGSSHLSPVRGWSRRRARAAASQHSDKQDRQTGLRPHAVRGPGPGMIRPSVGPARLSPL